MGKNSSNRRARAAKTKRLQEHLEKTQPHKSHVSSEMITRALDQDFAGLLKMKVNKNGLLNVSLVKQDARAPIMRRNEAESLLLRSIPAELRNRIFLMVVGKQHVHISVLDLPKKPADDIRLPSTCITDISFYNYPFRARLRSQRYSPDQELYQPWKNAPYPLIWRDYYTTQPIVANQYISDLHLKVPEKRVVWDSGTRMTQLATICRQIYDEVGLVPYSTNEFSFCSPYALTQWLHECLMPQRQAIKVLLVDNEWAGYCAAPIALKDLSPTGATLKVSQLAWKTVSCTYWKLHEHRDIGNTPPSDLNADMDNFDAFEKWLELARRTKTLKVEYVEE